ncbi:hypothetical protein SKA53_08231 [Yoonia vestfoldensis SKA53]|uniref:Uncharacterized protein n=2 Tax=Yoonia vestfoldensis TaxID=245188 RepID=A3V762_9RHOB|nr:hypothetical protein SKA53_08231 [Yoonia vestfoldensis SKA53]
MILPFLVLAACATPREHCISQATRDLRVLNSLIAETQGNLARGYAIEEQQEIRTIRQTCRGENSDGTTFRYSCDETETFTTNRPVAIDLNVEGAKLSSLIERRNQQQTTSDQVVLQCIVAHPE